MTEQPPPSPPVPPPYGAPPVGMRPEDERTWATAAHWSALAASVVGFPLLGPLLVLLVKGSQSQQVRAHSVESLNFQLSIMLYAIGLTLFSFVTLGIGLLIALPVVLVGAVVWLVVTILGTVRASEGRFYRYPLTIRLVS